MRINTVRLMKLSSFKKIGFNFASKFYWNRFLDPVWIWFIHHKLKIDLKFPCQNKILGIGIWDNALRSLLPSMAILVSTRPSAKSLRQASSCKCLPSATQGHRSHLISLLHHLLLLSFPLCLNGWFKEKSQN